MPPPAVATPPELPWPMLPPLPPNEPPPAVTMPELLPWPVATSVAAPPAAVLVPDADAVPEVPALTGTWPLITAPSLKPIELAIWPQPMPLARICRMPWVCVPVVEVVPISAPCSCSGVGLAMPCAARSARASDSAILMLP